MDSFRDLNRHSNTEHGWSPDGVTNEAYGGHDHVEGQPRLSDNGTWDC